MQAYIEGPYGAPMVDVHGLRYKCFMLVSTGMGWTFVRAWKRQLVQVCTVSARAVVWFNHPKYNAW